MTIRLDRIKKEIAKIEYSDMLKKISLTLESCPNEAERSYICKLIVDMVNLYCDDIYLPFKNTDKGDI